MDADKALYLFPNWLWQHGLDDLQCGNHCHICPSAYFKGVLYGLPVSLKVLYHSCHMRSDSGCIGGMWLFSLLSS